MPRSTTSVFLAAALLLSACSASDPIGGGGGNCANLLPGDLVVDEIFANPTGEDSGKEWFEIYNASGESIDLAGISLVTSKNDGTGEKKHRMSKVSLGAGDYLVIGTADPNTVPDYVDYIVGNDLGDLRNTAGRIAILCGTKLLDETKYDTVADGASRSLGGVPDAVVNDDDTKWCVSKMDFAGGKGTPGSANEACPGMGNPTMCTEGSNMRMLVSPAAGDLTITEWLPNPSGTDDLKEWFEVLVNRDVDLNGLELGPDPNNVKATLTGDACLRFAAGRRVLFARSKDMSMNGGMTNVDFTFTFTLGNTNASIFVGSRGGTVLDQVMYATSGDGVATQLDNSKTAPADNEVAGNLCPATMTFGAGDKGTPGMPNGTCGMVMMGDQCSDGGTMRDVVVPQVGDLVISEWMADPNMVTDASGEWFEVLATKNVDLNGLQLGTSLATIGAGTTLGGTSCLKVTAGTYVVFARNSMSMVNGGLPAVDYTFDFDLVNTSRGIALARGGALLDAVTYAASSRGTSTQIKPDKETAVDNDLPDNTCPARAADTYGLGDHGTPGKANACM